MRKSAKKEKNPFSVRLLNFGMVLMLIIAVSAVTWMIAEVRSQFSRERYSSAAYYASEGDYGSLLRTCSRTGYDIEPFPSVNKSAYEVGLYADAAFQHLYFETVGDEEQSALHAERMEAARAASGDLAPLTSDIDSILAGISLPVGH